MRDADRPPEVPVFWWLRPEVEELGVSAWLDEQYAAYRQYISARGDYGHRTLYAARGISHEPELSIRTNVWGARTPRPMLAR